MSKQPKTTHSAPAVATCLTYPATGQRPGHRTKYEYDAYGNLLAMSGPMAAANLYRFSSKEWNANSGLYCYLYRFYDPNLQRWVNRDPLGEGGFDLLY
jgi:RHS repeat-associated protein